MARRRAGPSLRFRLPASSLPAPALACAGFAGAPGFIEPFVTAAFFVFAISISVRDKPLKSFGFVPVFPRLSRRLAGVTRAKTPRANYQSCPARVYTRNAARARIACLRWLSLPRSPTKMHANCSLRTASAPLESVEALAAGSVNSNFSVRTPGRQLFLRLYEEQDRAGAEAETAMVERLAGGGRADARRLSAARRGPRLGWCAASRRRSSSWRQGSIRCTAQVTPDDARAVGRALARVHLGRSAGEPRGPSRFRYEDLCARLDWVAASGDARFAACCPGAPRHAHERPRRAAAGPAARA